MHKKNTLFVTCFQRRVTLVVPEGEYPMQASSSIRPLCCGPVMPARPVRPGETFGFDCGCVR